MTRREEDVVWEMSIANSHDYLMFFTNLGKVYKIKCYEIPEGSRTSKGINVANLIPISGDERVTSMIRVPEFEDGKYLDMVTKFGIIKRTELNAFSTTRKGGLVALVLDDGDELSWVRLTGGNDELIVATKKGKAIRFHETDVRCMSRKARGVFAMRLDEGDIVTGMIVVDKESKVLTISETGYGRLSDVEDYRLQSRGGRGVTNYHVEKYGDVAAIGNVKPDEDVIIISENGVIIRIVGSSIRECARPSKGVRVMRTAEDNKVVAATCIPHEEDEIEVE